MPLPVTDPVLVFAIVMLIILVAPIVFNRLRIPGIVGLIVAGAIVGPTGLGLLARDATMILLGTVGLLYLMFVAGLSIDLNQFEKLRNRSIVFGLFSFLLPLLLSIGVCTYLLGYDFYAAVLVGSVVGSHTLLAYPIAQRLGISRNKSITMATGGTILTDTLALTILAVVVAATAGLVGSSFWIRFIGFAGAYVGAVLVILPRLGRWFFRYTRHETNVEFVFLIAILFLTAFLADLAGLAPIIGAFLAGLTINRLVPDNGVLMSRVRFVGDSLFIPFFLISVGMLVDFGVLIRSFQIWGVALVFISLVVVGKLSAAKIVQVLYRSPAAEGWAVFGLTVPQAAATLAVTLVAFEVGLFDQTAVNAVVIMILATCILGPWMVEKYGREVALQEAAEPYKPTEAPQRILVPLANPATAEGLMDLAFLMRDRKTDESIFPLTVVRGGPGVEAQVASSEKMLSHAVIHAAAADVPVNPLTRVDMNVAGGINRAITERRISTVVIGWNGEVTAPQRIFGSVLDQVLEQSQQLVLVSKLDEPISTISRVVLAVPPYAERDFGVGDAIRVIKTITNQLGAELLVICTQAHAASLKQLVETAKPELPVEVQPMRRWSDLPRTLPATVRDEDVFMLISARRGSLIWRPALDRLPALLSQRFRLPNFVIIYPSEIRPDQAAHVVLDNIMPRLVDRQRVVVDLNEMSAKEVLQRLILESRVSDDPTSMSRVIESLLSNAPDHLPEIIEGVVLFHAHSDQVEIPQLFIGISREGLLVNADDHPLHVVLLLLSPIDYPAESHLHTLSTIAGMFRGQSVVENLRACETPDDVLQVLAETLTGSAETEAREAREAT